MIGAWRIKYRHSEVLIRMPKIKAREIAADVHSGLGDTVMMQKYRLSAKQLEGVLRKLVEVDLISYMQLYERTSLSDSQITKAFVDSERAQEELN
jgi:hypothetical protein